MNGSAHGSRLRTWGGLWTASRYRRTRVATALLVFGIAMLAMPGHLPAQDRVVVQIDPLENRSGEAQLDPLGAAVRDGMSLTLRLLGRYRVNTDAPASPSYAPADLQERAVRDGVDNIIFGGISELEDGGYRISLSAYDRARDEITFQDEVTFGSLLDTFGVVDDITLSMVEGFSGIRLTFGSLEFEGPGGGEPITVVVDGVDLGSGQGGLDRVPAGDHQVIVRQERPLGVWESTHDIVLETDERRTVLLETPVLTAEEAAILDAAVARRQAAALEGSAPTAPEQAALDMLQSAFFQQYRGELAGRYLARLESTSFARPADGGGGGGSGSAGAPDTRSFPGWFTYSDRSILQRFRDTPTAATTVSAHVNNLAIANGTFGRYAPSFRRITVDGEDSDWEGIEPFTDPVGDTDSSVLEDPRAADIVEVRIAYDHEYLYLMFRTDDRQYRRRSVGYKFHFGTPTGRVYIDHWPADELRPWIGYEVSGDPTDREWSSLRAGTVTRLTEGERGSVLETALPLDRIVGWSEFAPVLTDLWCASEHIVNGNHETVDRVNNVNAITRFAFPVAAYLADVPER